MSANPVAALRSFGFNVCPHEDSLKVVFAPAVCFRWLRTTCSCTRRLGLVFWSWHCQPFGSFVFGRNLWFLCQSVGCTAVGPRQQALLVVIRLAGAATHNPWAHSRSPSSFSPCYDALKGSWLTCNCRTQGTGHEPMATNVRNLTGGG